MRYILLLLISITFFACSKNEKKPTYLWEEERFVEVLTEFQVTESLVRLGFYKNSDSLFLKDSIYQSLFNKMEINREEFDSNFNYYMKDPKRMEDFYDKVMVNLSQRSAIIKGESK
jgi:hypothetical protein